MKRIKLIAISILLFLCLVIVPAFAQENNTTSNETNVTLNETTTEPTAHPNATETTTPILTDGKFRVGPTVTLRPVNDVIDKHQDGLVELYMNNPSLNDVTLYADVQISVPSGIHVYGEGFGYGGAAGTVAGTFEVPPGTVRTIHINTKSEKVGNFNVHFTGLYWPDGDKDAFQQISLTHPLTVKEPSSNPTDPEPGSKTPIDKSNGLALPFGILSMIAIVLVVLIMRK
jgi:hypothetical protein